MSPLNIKLSIIRNSCLASYANFFNFFVKRKSSEKVLCPCCGWEGPAFIAKSNWRAVTFNSQCPKCNSYSRHRGLMALLPTLLKEISSGDIIIFAPENIILQKLSNFGFKGRTRTTDRFRTDVNYPNEDIQNLSFKKGTFSVILCNHVLEHIPDDRKAIMECSRILRLGGIALFTVPGDFSKKDTWVFDMPDNNGHYRHYGMDIVNKFEGSFAEVKAIDMSEISPKNWGVRQQDYVFICFKEKQNLD